MINKYYITIYLDTRRKNKKGKYPVKLRLYANFSRKQKLYPTPFDFTEEEFHNIWVSPKPRSENKEIKMKLQALEIKANKIASKMDDFSIEEFENQLFSIKPSSPRDITSYYQNAIEMYKRNNQIGTASNYDLSLKSLLEFHKKKEFNFRQITPQWLRDYEKYMIEEKNRSQTTVGIYLRPLRAIFNIAIEDKVIDNSYYPFSKRKYSIPRPRGTKKALSKEQLKILFDSKPETSEQQKAKDFWFFSYSCNGMNFKDIISLKYKDISDDILTFRRAKTINTNKNQTPVIVYLNDFTKMVMEKYGNPEKKPDNFIFPIIDHNTTPEQKHRKIQIFIRFVNQHFVKFANKIGIDAKVSTYWARHSFATNAIRSGASMEYVSEALNHTNLNTTRGYFAGFESDKKKEMAKKIMNFDSE